MANYVVKECYILKPREDSDGVRVSTMSRHTMQDGKTHDYRLDGMFDLWLPELSPGPILVGSWYRKEISWNEFILSYRDMILSSNLANDAFREIKRILKNQNVSLMCIEEDAKACHRSVLLYLTQAAVDAGSPKNSLT